MTRSLTPHIAFTRSVHRRSSAFLLLGCRCTWPVLSILILTGCSDGLPERVPVAGTLTIDGKPLAKAFVNFYPASGRSSNARTDEEGRFVLGCFEDEDGAQVGNHEVSVIAVQEINPNTMKWYAPKSYSRVDTSGLSFTVDKPVDDLKIDLTWNGGKPFVERYAGGD